MNYIQRPSKLSALREEIVSLISQHGHQLMMQAILSTIPDFQSKNNESYITEPLFEEACEYFLSCTAYTSLSPSTKNSYQSELNQYCRYLKKASSFKELTLSVSSQSTNLLNYLEAYKGSNTYMKKCAFLRTFLRCTFTYYYGRTIDQELKDLLPVTWNKDLLPKFFSKAQTAELLSLAASTNMGDRNYAIVWTFLASGIRLNELCKLQIKDILVEDEVVMVIPKRKRRVRTTDKVRRNINKLGLFVLTDFIENKYNHKKATMSKNEYNDLFIFSASHGKKPLAGRTVEHMVRHIITSALSIPVEKKQNLTVHSFRHTFAVYGLESGLDIFTLSKLLGHSSIQTTTIYLRLHDDQLKEAINKHPFAQELYFNIEKRLLNQ